MRGLPVICSAAFFLLSVGQTPARMICVPADSSSIQAGINGAFHGDTVLVSKGLYYERINFLGKGILVASDFIFDQDTSSIDSTIIDADPEVLASSDTGCVVCFVSGEDTSSKIVGFTIQNGCGLRFGEYSYGGGIVCFSSSPHISYNKIFNNHAYYGGGICCYFGGATSPSTDGDSSPLIMRNRFIQNHAPIGGAILCESSSPLIIDNVFLGNQADMKGGAIFFKICSPQIIGNHIENNTTDGYGGGICGHSGSLILLRNRIVQNSCVTSGGGLYSAVLYSGLIGHNLFYKNSAQSGGGIYCFNCSSLVLNNTMVENSSAQGAGGIHCGGPVYHPRIINNIICLSSPGEGIRCDNNSNPLVSYNDVWGNASGNFVGCAAGVGDTAWGANFNGTPADSFYNIVQDPLFADSAAFELSCFSPCIDAGDPSYQAFPDSGGCRIDMGSREGSYLLGDANSDSAVHIADVVSVINYLFIEGPTPCPYHSADADCDALVDIADAVYLISYLFAAGPPPGF